MGAAYGFSSDGDRIFIVDRNSNVIHQLDIGRSGYAEFRICADSNCNTVIHDWRTENVGPVDNLDYIQLRMVSPDGPLGVVESTVNIGSISATWEVSP